MITNEQFLTAVFGEDAPWSHVTSFAYPPDAIPSDKHSSAWKGDYACRAQIEPETNQYFTISTFYCDEQQQARRRKALFRQTHCIVLDDVKEKLAMSEVSKLPAPSWVLETSQGSEQWGYILTEPCTDRARVENLLDGLVAQGLAPDGKDPGMKGVTRYVRLPEGINNKTSKGFFRCRMLTWQPFSRVTLEQLAAPFSVDLDAARRESRVDGAAQVDDHPLLHTELLNIKEVRSDGRFDITCPWVSEHTEGLDNGAAIFTNADGSIGFKCHHGACQSRTGKDLLLRLEHDAPGFTERLKSWQILRDFGTQAGQVVDGQSTQPDVNDGISFLPQPTPEPPETTVPQTIQTVLDDLRRLHPTTEQARLLAASALKVVDTLPKIEQKHWHSEVCDIMHWSKMDLKDILRDLRAHWYEEKASEVEFLSNLVYVNEINRFYDYHTRIFYTPEAFQNAFGHEDGEARKTALIDGLVQKVDKLDYAPKMPRIFNEGPVRYANAWNDETQEKGLFGDCSLWVNHFDILDWTDSRDHIISWMAYTLRHPENKINHMLLLGSGEGCGKDFLLYPLMRAMGDNAEVIGGDELTENFSEYLFSTKYLHINEVELGDYREAKMVSQKLKPLAAAPPEKLSVNRKGVSRQKIRNIVNCTMATNSTLPIRLNSTSRRFYAVWSDFNPRDSQDRMLPHWQRYWEDAWNWMKGDGWRYCVQYLMNYDLSGFNPAAAPPMTEFLREIKEDSKSAVLQTIEIFIRKQLSFFTCDLLTSSDMSGVLMYGALFGQEMLCDNKLFTERRIAREMRECGSYRLVKTREARVWVLRNPEKYATMKPSEIYEEYRIQHNKAKQDLASNIKAVV